MIFKTVRLLSLLLLWIMLSFFVYRADNNVYADEIKQNQKLNLPYAFYNESFGASVGYVYGITGYPQKQSSLIATLMAGSKGSGMGFLMGSDIRLQWMDRLFLDPVVSVGYFTENDAYMDGNPTYGGQQAGSNDSEKGNYVTGDGWDNFFRLKFKYLLPMGHGKDEIITNYVLADGFLKSGATGARSMNPFDSGRTYIELRPFYRSQQIDGDDVDSELKTNGLDLSLFWDNRDFYKNPTSGNSIRLRASRDFGLADSSDSWTSLDSEIDTYFNFGETKRFRARVLALDFWTSYSPTWEYDETTNTGSSRPPAYVGATLGGLWRMKGYPAQRFSDKAAIYYSAEYRLTPHWNPFKNWEWLQKHVGIEWIQLVPFVEIGRVAPSYDIGDLHSDMKWSAGLGLRALAKGLIIRVDSAASDESVSVQMMVNHPFQF